MFKSLQKLTQAFRPYSLQAYAWRKFGLKEQNINETNNHKLTGPESSKWFYPQRHLLNRSKSNVAESLSLAMPWLPLGGGVSILYLDLDIFSQGSYKGYSQSSSGKSDCSAPPALWRLGRKLT